MGNRVYASKPKLIIVGASFAGLSLVDKVIDLFDIVLIEKKDYFEVNHFIFSTFVACLLI